MVGTNEFLPKCSATDTLPSQFLPRRKDPVKHEVRYCETCCDMRNSVLMADPALDQDYEIVPAPTDLRGKVRELTPREAKKFDPVKAAEAALGRLSQNFGNWMDNETRVLMSAWKRVQSEGLNESTLEGLFQAAHNIKGQALTLGFPLVGDAAASFCHLIETVPSPKALPLALVGQYVEAIRAMVMEGAKDGGNKTGVKLLKRLESVTNEFLARFPEKTDK